MQASFRRNALDQICENIASGEFSIGLSDLRSLYLTDIENIRQFGDMYFRRLIEDSPASEGAFLSLGRDLLRAPSPTEQGAENPKAERVADDKRDKHQQEQTPQVIMDVSISPEMPIPRPIGYRGFSRVRGWER